MKLCSWHRRGSSSRPLAKYLPKSGRQLARRAESARLDPGDQSRHALQRGQDAVQDLSGPVVLAWRGAQPRAAWLFLRLAPEGLTLGAGMHRFFEDALASFRQAVLDPVRASGWSTPSRPSCEPERSAPDIRRRDVQTRPAGLPAEHPRARWLRHSGLVAATQQPLSADVFSEDLPGQCCARFSQLAPLQQWLVDVLPR